MRFLVLIEIGSQFVCHYVLVHMHALKAYGSWFVYVCNSDFSKVAKTKH